jgi:hypothetical protein
MTKITLEQLYTYHPIFISKNIIVENEKWGRIICEWTEFKKDAKKLHHTYAAIIHLQKEDLYLDCRCRKIFAKCVVLSITRPLHTLLKTAWHLSMIPIAYEIFKWIRNPSTKTDVLKNSVRSIVDIFRTPIYGITLTIISLVGAVIIPFSLKKAYDIREIYGNVEYDFLWKQKKTFWTLAPCFHSFFNINEDVSYLSCLEDYPDTDYSHCFYTKDHELIHLKVRLINFTRGKIIYRRRHWNLFDQFIGKLNPHIEYKSIWIRKTTPLI